MVFSSEADFEAAVIKNLRDHGWGKGEVIRHPSEEDLIQNWANILSENNSQIDKLNHQPLTRGEMAQILEKVAELRTPQALNGFINGRSVSIVRDNPADTLHFGKEVSLKIYDRNEIAKGHSRYQIVQQPHFSVKDPMLNQRRGDLMLLINGMPVFHIELKKSGIPISDATNQIEKYMHEGVFSGIFSLVQVFVAMSPEETRYFANPGPDGTFNKDYYFQWADFNNEPINDWKRVVKELLSIPMAHRMIGFYTVADTGDGILKVMRSYQFYAASRISKRVRETDWTQKNLLGGYIWHTTGSGKTMTSFKSAQLIASSGDADKVLFLVDRIELGTQSLGAYQGFADDKDDVQGTENTFELVGKLKSDNPKDALIVTSIQKMSRLHSDGFVKEGDLEEIRKKRVVFIVDECHRSTFGDMLSTIKQSFPHALFFGFTGTPIQDENKKSLSTTAAVFGNELHRYSIADGIRDHNVLGFDPYMVETYREKDLREMLGLEEAHVSSVGEVWGDPAKERVFAKYMDLPMEDIERRLPKSQYECDAHRRAVVKDVADQFPTLCRGKFHALLATSSIAEAIEYYRLFKTEAPSLKVTALFDPNIDNKGGALVKEDGLKEIIKDYNDRYGKSYSVPLFWQMKKDIAARLAHKEDYRGIEKDPEKQIDLLIVVDQMLTGFDSKWINTLYLDKMLKFEGLIQAFSRTNRVFGVEKPFGTIRYYRMPHVMQRNVEEAFALYSGDRPYGLFADNLRENLEAMNEAMEGVREAFISEGIDDFSCLPEDDAAKALFALSFAQFNVHLEAARLQGFTWDGPLEPAAVDGVEQAVPAEDYTDPQEGIGSTLVALGEEEAMRLEVGKREYYVLVQRYKELARTRTPDDDVEVPYEIETYLTEIDTGKIDNDYMNSQFAKWYKALCEDDPEAERLSAVLHRSFAALSVDDQKLAENVLRDIQSGDIELHEGWGLSDYITAYAHNAKNEEIQGLVDALGVDKEKLRSLLVSDVNDANINQFGRYDDLRSTVDPAAAKAYFEARDGRTLPQFKVNMMTDKLLRRFVLEGGFPLSD